MKSQVTLLLALVQDVCEDLGYDPSRDLITISRRCDKEGLSFLTVTLPTLDKFLLEGLRSGRLPLIRGWRTEGRLPLLFKGLWRIVFDSEGYLLEGPDVAAAIRAIRQLSTLNKKYKEVCSDDKVDEAIKRFIETDKGLAHCARPESVVPTLPDVMYRLFAKSITKLYESSTVLKYGHGPGAVAEKVDKVRKWDFPSLPGHLVNRFGLQAFDPTYSREDVACLRTPARLIAVPKTADKPRLISIEPAYNQFIQQGYAKYLRDEFARRKLICDFTDQTRNQRLSKVASVTKDLVTMDLSEASDRISLELFLWAFSRFPSFVKDVMACRSEFIELPGNNLMLLRKFASMGSAMTFPIQCMLFTGLMVVAAMKTGHAQRPSDVLYDHERYSVYGDDIIVPTDVYPELRDLMTKCGLKVNKDKTFDKGPFRESCGTDWYKGVNVTPFYLRYPLDTKLAPNSLPSLIETTNRISQFGRGRASSFLRRTVEKQYPKLKRVEVVESENHIDSAWFNPNAAYRWNRDLQRIEYRMLTLVESTDVVDDTRYEPSSLLHFYLDRIQGSRLDSSSSTVRYERPDSFKNKIRWSGI